MSALSFDVQSWPLVVTTIVGDLDEASLREYLDNFLAKVIGRGEPFASIVDARRMDSAPSAKVRRIIADWEIINGAAGERVNVGIAIVTTSMLVRGAMTAIQWVSPPRVPTTYEATLDAALIWARARLHERGVQLPRELHVG